VSADQVELAKSVLDLIRSTDEEVLDEMQAIITSTRKKYRNEAEAESTIDQLKGMLSNPPTRRALILGCGMMVLQQGIGINTVWSQKTLNHDHVCPIYMSDISHALSYGRSCTTQQQSMKCRVTAVSGQMPCLILTYM
jgi:hypothetical protein